MPFFRVATSDPRTNLLVPVSTSIRNAGVPQGHVRLRPEGRVFRHHRARQARQPLPQRRAEVERDLGGAGRLAARVLHDPLRRRLQERDPGECSGAVQICSQLPCERAVYHFSTAIVRRAPCIGPPEFLFFVLLRYGIAFSDVMSTWSTRRSRWHSASFMGA